MTEYAIEWTLLDGSIVLGAGRFPTREAAEEDVMLSFRNRQQWSSKYRIVDVPALYVNP